MKLKIIYFCWFLALLLYSCNTVPKSLYEPVHQSPFIFEGTVQTLNAATVEVPDSSNLLVVKVDEIISSTKDFDHLKGQNITIETDKLAEYSQGQAKVFVTEPWIFGQSVAVRDKGTFKAKDDPGFVDRVKAEVQDVNEQVETKILKAQLKTAEVIFSGEVVEVNEITPANNNIASEHYPQWAEAKIRVTEALKGLPPVQREVSIVFSNSIDIMWYNSPKFRSQDQGTWILSRRESEVARQLNRRSNLFVVTSPEEFTTDTAVIERIKKTLK